MPSEIFGYTPIENIHIGKNSTLYKAQDYRGGIVAVKINHSAIDPNQSTLSDISLHGFNTRKIHADIPNQVLVYPHVGDFSQAAYYYVEGVSAAEDADNIEDKTLNDALSCMGEKINTARRVIPEVMSNLEKLIGGNLVHRDIKGDNIILRPEGGTTLLDYDLLTEIDYRDQYYGVKAPGTEYFFSPEHAGGITSPTMDVTSLGIMTGELYMDQDTNLLSGISLDKSIIFPKEQRAKGFNVADPSIREKLLNLDRFPEELRTDVHGVICFLLSALNNDPSARPKSAEEARQLLGTTPNISMI